ncbi:MAG: hypothetical protein JKX95_06125 [Bacteroidia bacterium]|nr:hypothetical protein [Bacteroidia bacterium]
MRKHLIYLFLSLFLFSACGSSNESSQDDTQDNVTNQLPTENIQLEEHEVEISHEMMFEIIESIPAPIETATMIKDIGAPYYEELINSTSNAINYSTNFKKAVNLGIYGANLGYINIYNEVGSAVSYLSTISELANDLRVGQFFDFHTLKRLASNRDNLDSLLYISTKGFDKMNNYLKVQNRGNISVYMLVGGWLEALYLSTQIAESNESDVLTERIGEQKITIDNIRLLLTVYKRDPFVRDLLGDIEELKAIYDEVEITTTYKEPTMIEEDGALMIEDNTVTEINITKEQIAKIRKKASEIRAELIS